MTPTPFPASRLGTGSSVTLKPPAAPGSSVDPASTAADFATVDQGQPGTHFVSLQRTLEDFNATRAVMNPADARHHHPAIGTRRDNGINAFIDVRTRATFAVPARARRAYPYLRLA